MKTPRFDGLEYDGELYSRLGKLFIPPICLPCVTRSLVTTLFLVRYVAPVKMRRTNPHRLSTLSLGLILKKIVATTSSKYAG